MNLRTFINAMLESAANKSNIETVKEVAADRASGLPLKLALHKCLVDQKDWEVLMSNEALAALYNKIIADAIAAMLNSINNTGASGTQNPIPVGTCWILERCFPEDFASYKGRIVSVPPNALKL